VNTDPRSDLLRYYSRYYWPGVVDLSSSNPPPVPLDIEPASHIEPGELSYVPPSGCENLRQAIANHYETVEPGELLITAGASEALAAIALSLVRRGDVVVVDRGSYPSFVEGARTAGGEILRSAVPVRGAKIAAACNPSAPDGQLVNLDAYLARAESCGAIAVLDEVYRDLVHDGVPAPAAVDRSATAVSVGGLSKPLGMGGLRIGWIATHHRELRERFDRQLQLLSGGPASLSARAAVAAFQCHERTVAATLERVRANSGPVYRVLDAAGWRYSRPVAGLTLEARPPAPATLAGEERVRKAGMFLVPGEMYAAPGAYRISLLAEPGMLGQALEFLAEPFPPCQ